MQSRADLQIQSVLKAMVDVVLPALDPKNPLAQEQAHLCIATLGVMAAQLPLQFRFDCDELGRLLNLSNSLQQLGEIEQLVPQAIASLKVDSERAADVLARARAEPFELVDAVRRLRAATSKVVRDACEQGAASQTVGLERAVLSASREQLLRDRSWVIGQGWEPDPRAIASIETLIAPVSARDSR